MPGIEDVARLNQAFMRRAALYMLESGVNQFLDIGSGSPMVGDLHEIIHRADPDARMIYVDVDPVAIALAELLLKGRGRSALIQADPRDAAGILDNEVTRNLLDVDQPICLIAPMLHFVPNDTDPAEMLAGYRDRFAPGSGLVLLHVTTDTNPPGLAEVLDIYRATQFEIFPRTRAEVERMCAGFDLVEPGLVGFAEWRSEGPGDVSTSAAINSVLYAAVGRKP
jgi:hypothetical protein